MCMYVYGCIVLESTREHAGLWAQCVVVWSAMGASCWCVSGRWGMAQGQRPMAGCLPLYTAFYVVCTRSNPRLLLTAR